MKYQAVIFDFDYTLGDGTEGIVASVNYGLEKLGHPLAARESIRKTVGLSLEDTYRTLTGDESEEQAKAFAGYFKEKADQVMVENTSMFPDTMDVLRELRNQGRKIGIVTTKYRYRMNAILENCQAQEYFDRIVGGEDVKHPKPDPEGIFMVLDAWNLPKEQVLYVGDSVVDAKTAEAAGIDFAGVTTGTTSRETLESYAHVGVYGNLEELRMVWK